MKLRRLVAAPVNQFRGVHLCLPYVAPVMVLHYIEAYGYLPPESFIAAVLGLEQSDCTPARGQSTT